jgi:hypothetical protein
MYAFSSTVLSTTCCTNNFLRRPCVCQPSGATGHISLVLVTTMKAEGDSAAAQPLALPSRRHPRNAFSNLVHVRIFEYPCTIDTGQIQATTCSPHGQLQLYLPCWSNVSTQTPIRQEGRHHDALHYLGSIEPLLESSCIEMGECIRDLCQRA